MQKKSGVREGSDGVGAGRDGVDKWRGSWREARDVRAAEAATPKHWASIERRRKRQTAHKDKDKGRSSKRTRRALEAWAPKDTDEMLQEIADAGYGVSGDCSSAIARRLIKAYNSKADIYEKVVQKKGQPLREGFSVVKVRAARACLDLGSEMQSRGAIAPRD